MRMMDLREFKDIGFLQEVNRLFFHPRGLALMVSVDDETGDVKLSGVIDERDDPEGIVFDDGVLGTDDAVEKALNVHRFLHEKINNRLKKFGYVVQPIP